MRRPTKINRLGAKERQDDDPRHTGNGFVFSDNLDDWCKGRFTRAQEVKQIKKSKRLAA